MNVMLDVSIVWGATSVYTAFQKLNPVLSAGDVRRGSYSIGTVRQWTLSNVVFLNEGTIVTNL
jgi:hypothetical protein